MIKTIVRFSILIALVIITLSILQKLEFSISNSIINGFGFVITGSIMLFAINYFLKIRDEKTVYDYFIGFGICTSISIIGKVLALLVTMNVPFFELDHLDLNYAYRAFIKFLPINILLSLVIPATFGFSRSKGKIKE